MKTQLIPSLCALLFLMAFGYVTGIKVSGTITDESGQPVPGASVFVKGSTVGTSSDNEGKFSIAIPDENAVLVISAVGFQQTEVKIRKQKVLNIKLKQQQTMLEEVVVTGLNTDDQALYYNNRQKSAITVTKELKSVTIRGLASHSNDQYPVFYNNKPRISGKDDGYNREGYDHITENSFLSVTENPLSTFSIDVDAASYSNIRRILKQQQLPPAGAVRIEEMINYFNYKYPQPKGEDPFTINTEMAPCPWNENHRIMSIGLQGKKIEMEKLPPSNLTFLIDVSGSMASPEKLPLVKASLQLLADQLREEDRVSIVVYAGSAGLVLPPTSGADVESIKNAIQNLEAGGSTAGGQGIKLAYATAKENFYDKGNNRVVLCTDGDFNVGVSSDDELVRLIEKERESGIFLTVLGFGMGNYQDAKMQKLADKGNGNHAYIDNLSEAKKVLVSEFGGTLYTIAKDVKLQIEFNPLKVQGYRLIGYENRMLAKEDFNDDKKDAGELGSGHTVTALYEIIPAGIATNKLGKVDALKYQKVNAQPSFASNEKEEWMNIKLRYKQPDGSTSKLLQQPVVDHQLPLSQASDNLRFASAVAGFGMLLRQSAFKENLTYSDVLRLASGALQNDGGGHKKEFVELVKTAQRLSKDVAVESLKMQED